MSLISIYEKSYFIFHLVAFLSLLYGQIDNKEKNSYNLFLKATQKWFSAWELLSKEVYNIDSIRPVELIFFDKYYVYSTSDVTIKWGEIIDGNNFLNLTFDWKRKLHNDSITLPDNSIISISLLSFAAEIPNQDKSYFVMPLPDFWQQAGVSSNDLGLDNLITGIFIHEFTHSQQMQNFGKRITSNNGRAGSILDVFMVSASPRR